jgi:hypothetical protein
MIYIVVPEYDTDGEKIDLPESLEIEVSDELDNEDKLEFISDEISNRTGFCHFGFTTDPIIN